MPGENSVPVRDFFTGKACSRHLPCLQLRAMSLWLLNSPRRPYLNVAGTADCLLKHSLLPRSPLVFMPLDTR